LMAGYRSTAPFDRCKSILIVARFSAFRINGYVTSSPLNPAITASFFFVAGHPLRVSANCKACHRKCAH
jgi:hypothetical protein